MVAEINPNNNRETETSLVTNKTSDSDYGYPVHKIYIAKTNLRQPNNWTLLPEWELMNAADAGNANMQGRNVIWSLVNRVRFELCIAEFNSNNYLNRNKKPTDKDGRRTIDNSLIEYCDTVLFDFDNCPLSQIPKAIVDNAWLICPSASQTAPTESGDVLKMHIIHKMPRRIPVQYAKAYREIYLEEIAGNLNYDKACTDPRREFYGKHPEFTDTRFFKVTLENIIPLETHTRILLAARDREKSSPVVQKEDSLGQRIDDYLLENKNLEELVITLFEEHHWSQKGESGKCFDQWETNYPLHPDAKNTTAFAVQHSKQTGRILCHYKGDLNVNFSLYELYYRYQEYLDGKDLEGVNVSEHLKGENFFKIVDKITEKLGLPKYPRDSTEKKKKTEDGHKGSISDYRKVLAEMNHSCIRFCVYGSNFQVIAYTEEKGTWSYASTEKFCEDILVEMQEDFNKRCESRKLTGIGKLSDFVTRLINYHRVQGWLFKQMPTFISDWIGLEDCDYNRYTNETAPFHPEHQVWQRWKIRLSEHKKDTNIKKWCLERFKHMSGSKEGAELMWYYRAAEYLGLGKSIWQCFVVSGASRTGKSAYCQAATALSKFAEGKKNPQVLLSKKELESPFALEPIDSNTTSLHFPEFNVNSKDDVEFVLSKIDSAKGININGKNKPVISIDRQFVIFMSIQDDVVFPADNDGVKIRLQPIKLVLPRYAAMPLPLGQVYEASGRSWHEEINDLFYDPEIQKQIFLEVLLNENSQHVIRKINELSNSEYALEQKRLAISQNTQLSPAFEEFDIEVTGERDDFILAKELKNLLKGQLRSENYKDLSTRNLERMLIQHFESKHSDEWEKMKHYRSSGEMIDQIRKMNGKVCRVIAGVRFKDKSNNSET